MNVSVEIQNGFRSSCEIQLDLWDTVLNIKQKIERSQLIPVSKQTLFFQGKLLQDDLYVGQYVITHNSRLKLFVSLDHNPNHNEDQLFQTDQFKLPSINELLNIIGPPVKGVSLDDNKKKQVLQNQQPPLPSLEGFFNIQDSSSTVGSSGNSQMFQTDPSPSALNSTGEFFNIQDSSLPAGRSDDSQVFQTEYSPPALNSTEGLFNSEVLHQTEQAPVPPNSIGDITYDEDQPLTAEHFSNIQSWPLANEEITNYQMVRSNNNPMFQTQQSQPLNSAEEITNKPERVWRSVNNSQVNQPEQSLPSKSVKEIINIPDSPVKKQTKLKQRKLIVMVLPFYRERNRRKVAVEVNENDNVEELRKELAVMQQRSLLNLPEKGYFFIHKQNVLDEDKSFRWNRVSHGDTIEIFAGSVTRGLGSTSRFFK